MSGGVERSRSFSARRRGAHPGTAEKGGSATPAWGMLSTLHRTSECSGSPEGGAQCSRGLGTEPETSVPASPPRTLCSAIYCWPSARLQHRSSHGLKVNGGRYAELSHSFINIFKCSVSYVYTFGRNPRILSGLRVLLGPGPVEASLTSGGTKKKHSEVGASIYIEPHLKERENTIAKCRNIFSVMRATVQ